MSFGSVLNHHWIKTSSSTLNVYMFPIAAGLLESEGLGDVFGALLVVTGVGGSVRGTAVGCPGLKYCG